MKKDFKFESADILFTMICVIILWLVYWIEIRFTLNFSNNGILPRTISGLQGVIFSPFIHSSLNHLSNNSVALLILIACLRFFYKQDSFKIIGFGILLSGLLTWIIGRQNYHIGASSLIYVLVSYMFFAGIRSRYYRLVALSLAIVLVYGNLIWFIFPHPEIDQTIAISWEGHLSGFLTGWLFSYYFEKKINQDLNLYDWQKPDFKEEEDDFIKNFDKNGNFIIKPKPEIIEAFESETKFLYHFKEKEKNLFIFFFYPFAQIFVAF